MFRLLGKDAFIIFLFCNLFPIFLYFLVFANGHLHLYE